MPYRSPLSLPAAALLLCGCTASVVAPQRSETLWLDVAPELHPDHDRVRADRAEATLHDSAGEEVGFARLTEDAAGRVHFTVHAKGLTPGLHGMHLHAVGACDGSTTPAFSSAGGHFNPTGREHGHHNPAGFHSGDLPNLVVNEVGVGRLSTTLEQFALPNLFDADGTALVLHQNEDDLRTDKGSLGPGNSGPRIACGVLEQN